MAGNNYSPDPKGYFEHAPQTPTTTNNVTPGGTSGVIANITDQATYANDSANIRNNIYQLTERIKALEVLIKKLGLR